MRIFICQLLMCLDLTMQLQEIIEYLTKIQRIEILIVI